MRLLRQALALLSVVVDDWTKKHKQEKLATWFNQGHNTRQGIRFFIGAGKGRLPNWSPSANPIESWHKTLADIPEVIQRASFTTFLENNVPAICKNASVQLATTGWLFQPSFIPYEMAAVALERLDKDCPLMASADKQTYIIMSRSYWATHPKTRLTVPLMKEYRDSLKGILAPRIKKEAACELCTSQHTIRRDMRYKGKTNTGWRCDCKGFVQSGPCSCVLMVQHLGSGMNLRVLLSK